MNLSTKKLCAVISLLLAFCMLFTACGESDDGDNNGGSGTAEVLSGDGLADLESAENVAYVLVYNPAMYDENARRNESLFTGDFGSQILVDGDRAGETLEEVPMYTLPQISFADLPKINPETDRADEMFTPYEVGDTATFNVSIPDPNGNRSSEEFECIATGKYANAWIVAGSNDASKADAEEVINNFDKDIYPTDTKLFGEARFAENGHKVNILFHKMTSNILGYFTPVDLFSEYDGLGQEYSNYLPNYEHAIVHVNKDIIGNSKYTETLNATVAHEFQHLICASQMFENGLVAGASTWINEAMSGFVEEYLYPGIQEKDNRYKALNQSKLIRRGQSMYSFKTDYSDIGVYGSVFLFSEYLAEKSGDEVFKKIHSGYRDGDSKTSDASVIKEAVSSSFRKEIENFIDYPKNFAELSKDEEWLSKLTLNFYISMLKYDSGDPKAFKPMKANKLLYDELDGTSIEGGGRVILATKKGKFTIPDDADEGLIYIGLDKDFNVITKPTFR